MRFHGKAMSLVLTTGLLLSGCDKKDSTKTVGPGSPPATATEQGGPPGAAAGGMGMRQDLSSPQSTLQTLARAMELGDVAVAKEAVTPESQRVVEAIIPIAVSMKKLEQAAVAKFGAGQTLSAPGMGMADAIEALRNADVKVNGDTATAAPKGEGQKPVTLKKVNGQWQADLTTNLDLPPGKTLEQFLPVLQGMARVSDQVAADIQAGKYQNVQEARQAFGTQMMAVMMPLMAGGNGPTTQPGTTTQPGRAQ